MTAVHSLIIVPTSYSDSCVLSPLPYLEFFLTLYLRSDSPLMKDSPALILEHSDQAQHDPSAIASHNSFASYLRVPHLEPRNTASISGNHLGKSGSPPTSSRVTCTLRGNGSAPHSLVASSAGAMGPLFPMPIMMSLPDLPAPNLARS